MDSIVNYFEKEFNLSEIEKAKLEYSLNVLFTDISKLLILFIIFLAGFKEDLISDIFERGFSNLPNIMNVLKDYMS